MASLPTHPRRIEDDTDEELSDEQIRELLNDAERRLREAPPPGAESSFKLPTLNPGNITDNLSQTKGSITRLDQAKLVNPKDRALANGIKKIEEPISKQQKAKEKTATAGRQWFNMPKTELTPELKRDLQLLKMRNVLDSSRHYKKDNSRSEVPDYAQVGTIIEGSTEFFSGRLSKKERKRTLAEEVLAQEADSGKFKNKYSDIMKSKASGKQGYYKALQAKRRKGKVVKP